MSPYLHVSCSVHFCTENTTLKGYNASAVVSQGCLSLVAKVYCNEAQVPSKGSACLSASSWTWLIVQALRDQAAPGCLMQSGFY